MYTSTTFDLPLRQNPPESLIKMLRNYVTDMIVHSITVFDNE